MLPRLNGTDLILFGQAGRACRAAVVAFGVPRGDGFPSDDSDGPRGLKDVLGGRFEWRPGGTAVGARARVRVG